MGSKQIPHHFNTLYSALKWALQAGFFSAFTLSLITVYLFKSVYETPLIVTMIVVALLISFAPFFYIKSKIDKQVISIITQHIIEKLKIKGYNPTPFSGMSEHHFNHIKIFQHIDLVETNFAIKSENKEGQSLSIAHIECFNFVHRRVNNKDRKEGKQLPVFDGVFIEKNTQIKRSFTLISQETPINFTPFSTIRFHEYFRTVKPENRSIASIPFLLFPAHDCDDENEIETQLMNELNVEALSQISKTFVIHCSDGIVSVFIPRVSVLSATLSQQDNNTKLLQDIYLFDVITDAI